MPVKKESLEAVLGHNNHIVWKVVGDGGILLNLENGEYFEVNSVGLAIWQKLDGRKSLAEIARTVSREFKEDLTIVQHDIQDFAADIRRRKFVSDMVPQKKR